MQRSQRFWLLGEATSNNERFAATTPSQCPRCGLHGEVNLVKGSKRVYQYQSAAIRKIFLMEGRLESGENSGLPAEEAWPWRWIVHRKVLIDPDPRAVVQAREWLF